MEVRAQVAYHFKIDPAKLTPGRIQLPDQITRTVSVGDEMTTEKVSSLAIPVSDRVVLIVELEKQTAEQTRTARPAGAATTTTVAGQPAEDDEMSAF
jgi:hypothetical protein